MMQAHFVQENRKIVKLLECYNVICNCNQHLYSAAYIRGTPEETGIQ